MGSHGYGFTFLPDRPTPVVGGGYTKRADSGDRTSGFWCLRHVSSAD